MYQFRKNILSLLGRSLIVSLATISLSSCQNSSEKKLWPDPDKGRIVSTTEMVHAIVASIGKDAFQYQVLITGELDPHSYQLVKGDGERLASAHQIFASGLSLEHGPSLKKFLETSKKTVFLGDVLAVAHPGQVVSVTGQVDPHIWMDVSLFAATTHEVAKRMALMQPEQRDLFYERARRLRAALIEAHDLFRAHMQQLPDQKRYLVTSHDAFHYFVKAYIATEQEKRDNLWQERMIAAEGLAPESQISISQIARVADFMQKKGVHTLFAESNINTDAIKKIESVLRYRNLPVRISLMPLFGDSMPSKSDYERIGKESVLFSQLLKKYETLSSQEDKNPGMAFLRYVAMQAHNVETIHRNLSEESGKGANP